MTQVSQVISRLYPICSRVSFSYLELIVFSPLYIQHNVTVDPLRVVYCQQISQDCKGAHISKCFWMWKEIFFGKVVDIFALRVKLIFDRKESLSYCDHWHWPPSSIITSWLRHFVLPFHYQSHPFSRPVLPFGLCHSEQPFVLSCPTLLPQIEVVNTFKSGTSFQGAGALRRQSSTTSQTQDVTNVSSPSHVSLSNALSSPTSTAAATAPSTTGRESDLCQSAPLLLLLQGCH